MKRLLFLVTILFVLVAQGGAQSYFPKEKNAFLETLKSYFNESKSKDEREKSSILMKGFSQTWSGGYYDDKDAEIVIDICNKIYGAADAKNMNYSNLYMFVSILEHFSKENLNQTSARNWLSYSNSKFNSRSFKHDKYLQRCYSLFTKGILEQKGSTKWNLKDAKITIPSSEVFDVAVSMCSLTLASQNDSSTISNTQGVFHFETSSWNGSSGKVDWSRFKLSEDSVYAILPNYKLDLKSASYKIDSVRFYNKNYFNYPIICSFEDKVSGSVSTERTPYPKAVSYDYNYEIKNLFDGVNVVGGMGMTGTTVNAFGNDEKKAALLFYRKGQKSGSFFANHYVISTGYLISNKVMSSIYIYDTVSGHVEVDSVFHNGLGFRYDNAKRKLLLYREDTSPGDSPFLDSYHEVEIFLECLYWPVDSDQIEFKRMEGVATTSEGSVSSMDYFRESDYSRIQGLDNVHPMVVIEKFLKSRGRSEDSLSFSVSEYASYVHYPLEQAVYTLLKLQSLGYLNYDVDNKIITLNPRFFDVIASYRGKKDHDVIKMDTKTKNRKPNLVLDLHNYDLTVRGISKKIGDKDGSSISLSDVKRVVILPSDSSIIMKKDRNFRFTGIVLAGLFEFYTKNCLFYYDDFYIKMPEIDSMRFYVYDNRQMIPVQGALELLKGHLIIDSSDNKSSVKETPNYPEFVSEENSYKFYRDINEGMFDPGMVKDSLGNMYLDGKFYYFLDPFSLDSLNNLNPDNIKFKGKLISGGIFPDINEPLGVMPNYSLGLDHYVENESGTYPMYGGKGFYHNHIHLSKSGFYGNGQIDYMTSELSSDKFWFYLDSVSSQNAGFVMNEQKSGVQFPQARSESIEMLWDVNKPQLKTNTLSTPICLYDSTFFIGETYVSPEGFTANGSLTFGLTKFDSKYFDFKDRSFVADSANFTLFTKDQGKDAFLAINYKTTVDFDNQKVLYNYIDTKSSLKFPFNQYMSSFREAEWNMKDNRLRVYSPTESLGSYATATTFNELLAVNITASKLISTHPSQDSLNFYCMSADYDMDNDIINAHDVKIIRLADAAVFPSDGEVVIMQDAQIVPLKGAHILADTMDRNHTYYDADISIYGKNNFMASAYMDYVNMKGAKTPIFYDTISPRKGLTVGVAHITDSANFMVNPNFSFCGRVVMTSTQGFGTFDGKYKMVQSCYDDENWFAAKAVINPMEVKIPINMDKIQAKRSNICNGLYYEKKKDGKYFVSFLSKPAVPRDYGAATQVDGILSYDMKDKKYVITNYKEYNTYLEMTERCVVTGNGNFDLGLNTGMAEFECNGSYVSDLLKDELTLDVLMVLDFPKMDEKIMDIIAARYGAVESASMNLGETNFLDYFRTKNSEGKVSALSSAMELEGYPAIKANSFYNKSIVIPKLKMVWNQKLESFVSVGEIGLGNINRNVVNKYVKGYVVINRRFGVITILLKDGMDMTYFSYDCGTKQLQIHSTWGDINKDLAELKDKDREIKSDNDSFEFDLTPFSAVTKLLSDLKRAGVK